MEFVFSILAIAFVVAFVGTMVGKAMERSEKGGKQRRQATPGLARPAPSTYSRPTSVRVDVGATWVPPLPKPDVVEAWGEPGESVEVVGEQFREEAFRSIMGREPGFYGDGGAVIHDPAILVMDPHNPYSRSRKAVAVYVRGSHVGYLADGSTAAWYRVLPPFENAGCSVAVKARTWAVSRRSSIYAAVRISPPLPDAISPSNGLPTEPHAVVPRGRKRQVTREQEHLDVLKEYVSRSGLNEVAAVLRKITDIRPRSTKDVVQVEIDGRRVGVLSDGQSAAFLPLVEFVEARGKLCVVHAGVEGNEVHAEVVVWAPNASEMDQSWFDGLGPVVALPEEVIPGPDFMWDED